MDGTLIEYSSSDHQNTLIIQKIRDIWQWISSQGISDEYPSEQAMTRLLNQFAFISAFSGVLTLTAAFFMELNLIYIAVVVFVILNYYI
ncbi:MAG: hypothetical protein AAGD05_12410, partial [Bacteroidota bacterium]